jgi:large conductance mechanosensitive channel
MIVRMLQEFRDFAMKGNVVDLAVGVIIGAAFAPIVGTLVDHVIMPPIGLILAGIDFSGLRLTLVEDPDPAKVVAIKYGLFLNAVIKFVITAFAIFLLIKALNRFRSEAPPASAAPSQSEVYLKEIRDALVARK